MSDLDALEQRAKIVLRDKQSCYTDPVWEQQLALVERVRNAEKHLGERMATLQKLEQELRNAEAVEGWLRELLWLRHGHDALYGDDGERQCPRCGVDFKRDPLARLDRAVADADQIRQAKERVSDLAMRIYADHAGHVYSCWAPIGDPKNWYKSNPCGKCPGCKFQAALADLEAK